MITDEMLRAAASRSCELYAAHQEEGYHPEDVHQFSKQFERKIRKLKRKADHPILYHALRSAALVAIAILVTASAWLTVNVEARRAFFGWIKSFYETYFVYSFQDDGINSLSTINYRPTLLPAGYTEFIVDDTTSTVHVLYSNADGNYITFSYIHNPSEVEWFIAADQVAVQSATVSGNPADLLVALDSNEANALMWITEDNTAFCLSGYLDADELIEIAESVKPIE